jgi:hypothetical protein
MPSPEIAVRDFRPLVAQGARCICGTLGLFAVIPTSPQATEGSALAFSGAPLFALL